MPGLLDQKHGPRLATCSGVEAVEVDAAGVVLGLGVGNAAAFAFLHQGGVLYRWRDGTPACYHACNSGINDR